MGLLEVDFLFYEGNLEVKKILSSVYPFLWVENRGVLMKRCSQNVQLCNFIEIALWHGCFLVNPLHIFIISFPKNTSWLLLLGVIPLGIVMCTTRQKFQKLCFPVWLSLFSNFLCYRLSS